MSNENIKIINGVEVDTQRAQKILTKLIIREKTNIKTKQYNDSQMINQIKKLIEEEVECY